LNKLEKLVVVVVVVLTDFLTTCAEVIIRVEVMMTKTK